MENNYELSDHLVVMETNSGDFYAYNSLLGGLKKLTKEEKDIISRIRNNDSSKKFDIEVIDKLKKSYFLKTISDEYDLIKPILKKYKQDVEEGKSITKLLLYVTGNCMLRCSYCYINDAQEMDVTTDLKCGMKNMKWEVAKKSIDIFFDIINKNKQKKVHIRFHGGEPFINFEVIKKSMEYINDEYKNIEVVFHVNTNGVAMTEEIIDFWVSNSKNGKHTTDIEFSIDGTKEYHDQLRKYANGKGSYEKGINTIKTMIKKGYPVDQLNIATTLNKYNYKSLRELIDEAKNIGLKAIEINTLIFESEYDFLDKVDERVKCLLDARIYGIENGIKVSGKWFKLIERLYKPVLNYCGRMGQQIGSDLEGNVFLCTGYLRNFGKIENWKDIFTDEEYVNLACRIVGQIDGCKNCPIECVCAGGCPASAESSYGSFYEKESKECEFRNLILKELIKNIELISDNEISLDEVDSSYVPTLEAYNGEPNEQ